MQKDQLKSPPFFKFICSVEQWWFMPLKAQPSGGRGRGIWVWGQRGPQNVVQNGPRLLPENLSQERPKIIHNLSCPCDSHCGLELSVCCPRGWNMVFLFYHKKKKKVCSWKKIVPFLLPFPPSGSCGLISLSLSLIPLLHGFFLFVLYSVIGMHMCVHQHVCITVCQYNLSLC